MRKDERADRRRDRHDKANSPFSQVRERALYKVPITSLRKLSGLNLFYRPTEIKAFHGFLPILKKFLVSTGRRPGRQYEPRNYLHERSTSSAATTSSASRESLRIRLKLNVPYSHLSLPQQELMHFTPTLSILNNINLILPSHLRLSRSRRFLSSVFI